MRTAVVILNWNTEAYLRAFLPALLESCPSDASVIVADNGSTDGSLELLAREFPQVRTIAIGENLGFTGGYNNALAQVDAEYFVLINSDIQVRPGWLEPLVAYMDAHPQCGVCGPKLHALVEAEGGGYKQLDRFEYAGAAGGRLDFFGFPFCRGRVLQRTEKDEGQYDNAQDVLWVSGACLLTRSSLWRRLGGLDARFFAHMEEIDYCWRTALAGYTVTVVPESCVWHLGGGTLRPDSPFKLELNYRNNLLLLENDLPATVGAFRARVRILVRRLLDWGTAAVYLLTGKKDYARAVSRGHRGYRKLRREGTPAAPGRSRVAGYWKVCVILQSLLRGAGIFRYLKSYEDSNRGSR
ncbi:MAG: glycosyltransferase family 2 protein [Bacteroidales bacterium]|nr:glycosyltransferase family 2 protein [Bacteroidales bacterium]